MKTNIIANNTIMTKTAKYICTIVLMLGMSAGAWGTNSVFSYDKASINFGTIDGSDEEYAEVGGIMIYESITVTISQAATVKAYLKSTYTEYGPSYTLGEVGNEGYIGGSTGNYTFEIWTYFALVNGTYKDTIVIYDEREWNVEEIPVIAVVTGACTPHNVVYDHNGSGSDPSGDSGCEDDYISFTPSPSDGYKYNGATIYESDMETTITTLGANTTSFSMYDRDVYVVVHYTVQSYSVTLDREGGTTGATSMTVTYNSSTVTGFTAPTKEGYTFGGYYTGDNGTGTLALSTGGVLQASVSGYTGAGGIWTKTTSTTLYAKWTINSHKLTVGEPDYVAIKATTGGKDIIEGKDSTTVNYGSSVTLSYSGVTGGYAFNSWVVTKDADGSNVTASVVADNTLTMPDYDVTVSATMYAKAKLQTRCLAEPEFTVTGSVYLTSYANVEVFTTDNPDNRITITCSDFESANRLYITYLNGSGETVAKASSLFRLCNTDYSKADASNDYIDVSAVDWSEGQKFCIAYKPGAEEYNQTDTWTIRLTAKYGASTDLGHQDLTVHGRALPEKFVVAAPYNGQWYALPADMATSSGTVPTPYLIGVDNRETPTVATYANTKALFTGSGRYAATSNRGGIRLKSTTTQIDSKDAYVTAPNSNSATYLYLATGASTFQDWYLTSSNFSSYTVQINPAETNGRALRMYTGKIGYYPSSGSTTMYILPVTNEVTDIPATVQEWGEHGAIVAADMTNVASAAMHVENGSPVAADLSAVNAASLTAGKYVRIYNEDLTVGAVANEGKLLNIHWKNDGGTEIGLSQVPIPCVVASSNDMKSIAGTKAAWSSKSEVHVLPGVTLEANPSSFAGDGALSVSQMVVYPGATLKVTSTTFNASTLRLRNGWTRAGEKSYDVARVHIADDAALTKTTASMDYDIYDSGEGAHYYPIAVPFETPIMSTDSIDYADSYLARFSRYGTHYAIKKYNGATRAESGTVDEAWEMLTSGDTLKPGIGYIMTGVGLPAYGGCIIRIPLTFNNAWTADGELGTANYDDADHTKNSVKVTHHTGAAATANKCHEGWNMVGVPYMSCYGMYSGDGTASILPGKMVVSDGKITWDADGLTYVSVPTHDFSEYIQKEITDDDAASPKDAQLLPGWSFFVQIGTSGNLTFLTERQRDDSDLPIYAPQRTEAEQQPVIKTGIILSGNEASDKTTLLISDRYNSDYEIGADLEKMFGNGYTLATYSINNGTRLAFNAMSTVDARQIIPIGVRFPEQGEYTFSLNERYADANIESLDLIDYETGVVTNLMVEDYTFTATREQNDNRFALNVQQVMHTPTDIGSTPPDKPDRVRKIIMNDVLYIVRDGLLYDATGKRVTTINK